MTENKQDLIVEDETTLLCAVLAVLFTPHEVTEDKIVYNKDTVFQLTNAIDEAFQLWYNIDIGVEMKPEKET